MAMPPPGKKGLGIMIAVGRPKGGPDMPRGMKDEPGYEESPRKPAREEPDGDEPEDAPSIYPEDVNYHDESHSCGSCRQFGGGRCAVLKMEVPAEGGCNAFSAKGADEGEPDEDDETDGGDPER